MLLLCIFFLDSNIILVNITKNKHFLFWHFKAKIKNTNNSNGCNCNSEEGCKLTDNFLMHHTNIITLLTHKTYIAE